MAYVCDVCEKTFSQKGRYDSHKARKRPCVKPQESTNAINTTPEFVKPFLKWVGGKTQIVQDVMGLFPTELQNYHEPFVGGGSILLALLTDVHSGKRKVTGKIYASDWNSNLIGLYTNIQSNPEGLLSELRTITNEFTKSTGKTVNRKPKNLEEAQTSPESYYFWIRSRFNALSKAERTSPTASAMLLFMNKTCFRGVYREGPNGFNVPFGNYKNPSIYDEEHIRAVSRLFQGVVFTHCRFQDSLSKVLPDDFVYMDPPYAPENEKSFVSYTSDGFDLENHTLLFRLCGEMQKNNVRMAMSNADVNLVKGAFPAPLYTTRVLSCRRAIHSKEPSARTNEVLITNV